MVKKILWPNQNPLETSQMCGHKAKKQTKNKAVLSSWKVDIL